MPEYHASVLRKHTISCLTQAGLADDRAKAVVDHLITADLWRRPSHGLSVRLPFVHRSVASGVGNADLTVVERAPNVCVIDGGGSFGYHVMAQAAEQLLDSAQAHGLAAVAVHNTTHTGMLGYYVEHAARQGVVAMGFANCCPLMAPNGAGQALFGTNPLAFGFPAEPDPVVIDMATSEISYGDVMRHAAAGRVLPPNVALDADGQPTRDAQAAANGALLPFGGHRGGAIAMAVQLLTGVLLGGPAVPPSGAQYTGLLVGMRKDLFAEPGCYERELNTFVTQYLALKPRADAALRLPGTERIRHARENPDSPIAVSPEVCELLGLE